MMRMLGRAATAALIVGSLALASGCGSADDSSSASKKTSGGTIKLGTSLPLTGQFSEPGGAAKQGYETWAAEVNATGGLLKSKVDLVVKDDASSQNTVVTDYNALISRDKVDLVAGSFSALLNFPASAVAERNRKLYVTPTGGAPELYQRGFKTIFLSQPTTSAHQGDVFANYIASLPAGEKPATAAYPSADDPFAKPTVDAIRKILEGAGVKTVFKRVYPADTKNFDALADSVKRAAPDLVVQGTGFEDGVGLIRAFNKVGFTPKQLYQTSAPSLGDQYLKAVGKQNTEGVMFATTWTPNAKTTGNQQFLARYAKLFGSSQPTEDAADAYAAGQVIAAAVKAVGSIKDQTKLADWLRANTVDTIVGPLKWDAKGQPQGQSLLGQWQGGVIQIVKPNGLATSTHVVPQWRAAGK